MNLTGIRAIFGNRPPGKSPDSFLMCTEEPSVLTSAFCVSRLNKYGWTAHPHVGITDYLDLTPEARRSKRAYYKYKFTVKQFVAETFIDLL